jgi:hypothetical protein
VQVFEQFYKRFIGKLFGLMLVVGIAIADFHCIAVEPMVQRTLTAAVVFATSVNERQYINSFIAQNIAGVCRYGKVTLYQDEYEA